MLVVVKISLYGPKHLKMHIFSVIDRLALRMFSAEAFYFQKLNQL